MSTDPAGVGVKIVLIGPNKEKTRADMNEFIRTKNTEGKWHLTVQWLELVEGVDYVKEYMPNE